MTWIPLYDCAVVSLARRLTGRRGGFTQLARMGIGLVILTVAMLTAGALEVARRRILSRHGMLIGTDGAEYVPMSIFWQVPQYVVVGAAEVFTFIGQTEFFYDQVPDTMRSVFSGLGSAAFALGNYASSLLVAIVVRATATSGQPGWIPDDINNGH
jgi:peptide/histidine transporter 3/4